MPEIICAHCGSACLRPTNAVNRAAKAGRPLYCSRDCGNAARTARKIASIPWHKRRFEPRAGMVESACLECGKKMWLPPSKVDEYKRCGADCVAAGRERERLAFVRNCAKCGKEFRPRPVQVTNGGGTYCSHKCSSSGHLSTPEALAYAQQRRRENQAAGLIQWKTGADHHAWAGGLAAARKRRVESGKASAELRAYRAKNPHKMREWKQHRKNAKLARLPWGTVPRLGQLQRWKCAICRTPVRAAYHLDHIQPIARGGKHVPSNLQLLCGPCNLRKSARDPMDHMRSLGRLL